MPARDEGFQTDRFFTLSLDLFCITGFDGYFKHLNPMWEKILGFTTEELLGQQFMEFVHPEDWEATRAETQKLLKGVETVAFENRYRCKDGSYKWLLWNARSFSDEQLTYVTAHDITKRKQTEVALRESEARFRRLAEASFEGIIVHEQGNILDVNQAFAKMFGYELPELIGMQVLELTAPEYRDLLSKNILSGYEKPYEAVGLKKDGSKFPLELQGKIIPYEGQTLRVAAVRDLTERKRTEAALRESEERFRAIAETTPAPTTITRASDGLILYANPQVGSTFGLGSCEMIGRYAQDFHDDPRELQQLLAILQRDGSIHNYEMRFHKADGTPLWVSLSVQPLTFNGEAALLSAFYDITERKATEEALAKSEEQFRAIAEAIPNPLIISRTSDNTILYANAQVARTFGLSASEVIGYKASALYYDATDRQSLLEVLSRDGHITNCEVRGKRVDGTLIWFAISLRSIVFNGEQAVVMALYDITKRKRAQEALRETVSLRTLAADVGVALSEGGTLTEILDRCTEAMVLHLLASGAGIWTFNPAAKTLEPQAIAIVHPPTEYFQDYIRVGADLIGFCAQPNLPYFSASYQTEKLGQEEKLPSPDSPLSTHLAAYPLIVEERLVGVIALFTEVEIASAVHSTLGWVANAVAVAIDRAWARQELLSRREALLFQLASQIRDSLDLDTILETAVQEIRNLLQIERCVFIWYRTEGDVPYWEVVKEAKNPAVPSIIGHYLASSVDPLGEKLLNLEIIRIDEIRTLPDSALRQFLVSLSYTAVLSLPLETYSGQIGVVSCGHCSEPRPWSDSEVELLQAVTDQLAIAINQAELYAQAQDKAQQALKAAQQLEQTLLQLQQTQAQLIQTEKMSSLGQMVAGIAHEINNPVTFISGNIIHASNYTQDILGLLSLYQKHYPAPVDEIQEEAEAIDVDFVTEDLPKVLSSMHIGAQRIHQIVLSLRNFSRLDEAEMKPVDIHEGIDSTLLILQHRLKPKGSHSGIEIVKHYSHLPPVECYAGQLNQVFMNILSNAIDALEDQPEPRIITICTEIGRHSSGVVGAGLTSVSVGMGDISLNPPLVNQESMPPSSVLIRIRDNGSGMSEEVTKHLFDPFFTTKPVGKGTGLGLSISYQIVVEKHGGILQCFSQPGQGAEFWIEIPIAADGQ